MQYSRTITKNVSFLFFLSLFLVLLGEVDAMEEGLVEARLAHQELEAHEAEWLNDAQHPRKYPRSSLSDPSPPASNLMREGFAEPQRLLPSSLEDARRPSRPAALSSSWPSRPSSPAPAAEPSSWSHFLQSPSGSQDGMPPLPPRNEVDDGEGLESWSALPAQQRLQPDPSIPAVDPEDESRERGPSCSICRRKATIVEWGTGGLCSACRSAWQSNMDQANPYWREDAQVGGAVQPEEGTPNVPERQPIVKRVAAPVLTALVRQSACSFCRCCPFFVHS